MSKEIVTNKIRPKNILIQVTEGGKSQPNVRIPFYMVKYGMKIGQRMNTKKSSKDQCEMEMLNDIDLEEILSGLNNGELTLPLLLVDVEDNDKHVVITLE